MSNPIRIALIDDDPAILDALRLFLVLNGLDVRCFDSGSVFLSALSEGLHVDCIVSDVRMPNFSGLALQKELLSRGIRIPVILITGHGAVDMAVAAMKAGAHDFIEKPFDEALLLESIRDAVHELSRSKSEAQGADAISARLAELTDRQRAVLTLAVQGLTNKEIAARLGISTRTVEHHRAWVMERTGAKNLAHLIRMMRL